MRRTPRILLIMGGAILALIAILITAALIVIQTGWFRNYIRAKIIAAVEDSTGGRAEIGSFRFSPAQLRAEVDNFVLHGTEAPGQPPLLRVRSIVVGLKLLSVPHHKIDLDLLAVDQPQVYVEVKEDGTTNLPVPRIKRTTTSDPIQTVLDLAVRHFTIRNGLLRVEDRKAPFDVEGEKLQAQMTYNAITPKYAGDLSMTPVYVHYGTRPRLPVNTKVAFTIQQNRIDITSARFDSPHSELEFSAGVSNLSNPQGSLHLTGRLDPAEFGYRPKSPPVELALSAGLKQNTLDLPGLQVMAGASRLDASGLISDLKNPTGSIRFNGRLEVGQLGRIFDLSSHPEGTVTLGGEGKLDGTKNYDVVAKIDGRGLSFQSGATRIAGVSAQADVNVKPNLIAANNIRVAALGGTLQGSAGVVNMERFRFDAALNNFGTRYLASKYASRNIVWDGVVSGPVHVAGSLKGPVSRELVATAQLGIRPGPNGVPLSGRLDVNYDGPRDVVNLGKSFLQLPSTRLAFSGAIGNQLNIALVSRNLDDLLPAVAMASSNPPRTLPLNLSPGGVASFQGAVVGSLGNPRITGHLALTNFVANGQHLKQFAADLNAQNSGASVQNCVLAGPGLQAQVSAFAGLKNWKAADFEPVNAKLSVRGSNVHGLLAAAGSGSMPLTGAFAADALVSGTVGNPQGAADVAVTEGAAAGEPFNRVQAHVNYSGQSVQLTNGEVVLPSGRVALNAVFQHPPKQFQTGRIQFQLTSTPIQIQRLQTIRDRQPGLAGTVNLAARGSADLLPPAPNRPRFKFAELNANVSASDVELDKKRAGSLTLVANTAGQNLVFKLDSDLAGSSIHGNGNAVLAGDYPVTAAVTFKPIRVAPLMRLVGTQAQGPQTWDGTIDGDLTINGPALRPADLKGKLELAIVRITAAPQAPGAQVPQSPVEVHNSGPVVVTLDHDLVRAQSAHFTGPSTDLVLAGTVNLAQSKSLDLHAHGKAGLELAQTFSPEVFASGNIVLTADVRGSLAQPAINGQIQLVNASFNYVDAPNGLANANGVILFNGNQAVIQSLTGESGGGIISVSGLVRYGPPAMDFRLRATAHHVRVRQSSASVQVNGNIDLAGTTERSILSGDVTILQVAVQSHTDFGSLLSETATPPSAPSTQTGMLAGMRLDVHIQTSPAVQFLTPLTQNLQATADLRLRGSAARPGMLGRVLVTQGDVVFFGAKYTINQGSVHFYNPSRIEPDLDLDLETNAEGVDVTLSVSGPMDNLKLTYHSDPPLQFSDIIALLATGKPPTSDPVLAAQQPPAPQQNLQQTGASALLSQAIANPVSGRLQRLFGVTQLKIDPQIVGATNTVQARMTLQQQITRALSFTYIQDVRQSNTQVIRIEWAIDPTWSAVALRQENGEFGLDFFYKKRFK